MRGAMTGDDRLRLALEAAERGDIDRCRDLLHPIEQEIAYILEVLTANVANNLRND